MSTGSAAFETKGILHKIFPTESRGEKKFLTRDFILEKKDEKSEYSQFVKMQVTGDRCDVLDRFEENQEVSVKFDLRGREWQGKFLTNINCFFIESVGNAPEKRQPEKRQPEKVVAIAEKPKVVQATIGSSPEKDGLPFLADPMRAARKNVDDNDDLPF